MNLSSRLLSLAVVTLLAVASVGISSCDAITQAATIGVPITIDLYPASINPSIPTEDIDCADMTTIKDYQDNKDKIKRGELKTATFQILELNGPTFETSAAVFSSVSFTLEFDATYGDTKVYNLGTFTNVPLADLLAGPMTVTLSADAQSAIDKIVAGREKFCVKAVYGPFNAPIGAASADYLRGKISLTIDFKAEVL
jgi:hypothetical protein